VSHIPKRKKSEVFLPYTHRFSQAEIESPKLQIVVFADVFFPIVNGVVLAVEGLCRELCITNYFVILITPKMTRQIPLFCGCADIEMQLPSYRLPGTSGYRLALPYLGRRRRRELAEANVVHAHSFFVGALLGRRLAKRIGRPFVLTLHTQLDAYAHYAGPAEGLVRFLIGTYIRLVANTADVVTVPTSAIATDLRRKGVKARLEVIPSGVDFRNSDLSTRNTRLVDALRKHPGDALVLCVARLAPEKNVRFLLEAFGRLRRPATLLLAGDGPDRASLLRYAHELGLGERVRFLGMVERRELDLLYRASDLFAFPSMTETQGLVIAEALNAELPVVLIDTESARDVSAGSDARLTECDVTQYAQAMEDILASDYDEVRRRERKQAAARFDVRTTARRMAELYEDIANTHLA
jgi:1,2-diacylglycerol 3-alpha-glucosyltransferase